MAQVSSWKAADCPPELPERLSVHLIGKAVVWEGHAACAAAWRVFLCGGRGFSRRRPLAARNSDPQIKPRRPLGFLTEPPIHRLLLGMTTGSRCPLRGPVDPSQGLRVLRLRPFAARKVHRTFRRQSRTTAHPQKGPPDLFARCADRLTLRRGSGCSHLKKVHRTFLPAARTGAHSHSSAPFFHS